MAKIDSAKIASLTKKTKFKSVRTGELSQKIAATAHFQAELINRLSNEEKMRIQEYGLRHISKYFESYVDHLARVNPTKYHHVYEPGQSGDPRARLFKSSVTSDKNKAVLQYTFLPSRIPGESGQVFKSKAFIMESGTPVTITPKRAKSLVFEVDGELVFSKQSYVANPGGVAVQNSFTETFNLFMTSRANEVLIELGFYERIERAILSETKLVLRKISSGTISGMAMQASSSAAKISKGAK
jgi:hypothetical protein